MYLLPGCHKYVTEHPEWARDQGLIVSAYADPMVVPVWLHGTHLVLLGDDGCVRTDLD